MGLIAKEKLTKNNGPILGIDPGSGTTGYAVITTSNKLVTCGAIEFSNQEDLGQKLVKMRKHIHEFIKVHKPSAISCENQFSGKNVQSLLTLREIVAAIRMAASEENVDFYLFSPSAVKKSITGNGKATKEEVAEAVVAMYPLPPYLTVNLKNNNITDAMAIAGTLIIRTLNEENSEEVEGS